MIEDGVALALQAALEGSPDDVEVRIHLVDRLLNIGESRSALPHVQELLARAPERSDVIDLGILVLRDVGDEKAASALESARDADKRRQNEGEDATATDDPEPDVRRAMPVTGDDAMLPVPDTADELLNKWDESDAPEEVVFGELIKAGITLDDVGGLEQVKKQLHRSFLGPMRNPEMAAAFNKSAGGGLLLWGPPGCGKTFLARATAGEMGANFYNVGLADVLDMWIGASERNLAAVFETARRNAPCVLFFDEIDALGQKRSHLKHAASLRGVVNQLLSELDGVADDNDGVFTLAATNHPWDVDEALLRPGRFDRRLLVLPPDAEARWSILTFHLQDRPTTDVDLSAIIEATDGWSGADLAFIVESAVEQCLDESLDAGEIVSVTTAHLLQSLAEVPSTIGPWLEGARNHVVYSNRSGEYDELEAYLNSSKSNRRRPPGFRR
ncbi:MAG: AAA family ATPase [Acidimicrobiia bacterium]|nr:AAA family ATPase [Acidimicrobiia bacterium]